MPLLARSISAVQTILPIPLLEDHGLRLGGDPAVRESKEKTRHLEFERGRKDPVDSDSIAV